MRKYYKIRLRTITFTVKLKIWGRENTNGKLKNARDRGGKRKKKVVRSKEESEWENKVKNIRHPESRKQLGGNTFLVCSSSKAYAILE